MALDQAFDVETLHELRKAVLAEAAAAGMPNDRAFDVMLAMHELATNAVRHGGGAGRARMHVVAARELHCLVSDTGAGSVYDRAPSGIMSTQPPWPFRRGHGLWLVRNVADHLSMASDLDGSQVILVFALPGVPSHDG
jgi:anti-sigma regulatory factor (Ser/Thr protein kinase)